jgi:hypothetical protein
MFYKSTYIYRCTNYYPVLYFIEDIRYKEYHLLLGRAHNLLSVDTKHARKTNRSAEDRAEVY